MRGAARYPILLALLLAAGPASAYSTLSDVTLTRSFSPTSAQPGQSVTVTLTVKTGAGLSSSLRGFYISEAVPDALSAASGSATLDGKAITVKTESTSSGAIYTGAKTLRWILEQPPSWSENNPLPASATLVVTYAVSVPSSASSGFSFPGASWVGMIPSLGDAGDNFGYEDKAATLPVDVQPKLALSPTSLSFSAQEGGSSPASQSVAVTNGGGGTLAAVSAAVTYGSAGTGWLTVTPSGSGNSQSLDNAVDLTGLAPNTYSATVKVSASGATNSPQSYTVSFTLTAKPSTTDPTIVLSPTSLQFSAEEGGAAPAPQTVSVTNSGAGTMAAVSAKVSYISGAGWLMVAPGGVDNGQSLKNLVDSAGLAPDTYTATVAVSSSGASNTPQNYTVSLTVTPGSGPSPDAGVGPDSGLAGDAGVIGDGGNALNASDRLVGGCQLGRSGAPAGLGLLLLLGLLGLRRRR